MNHDGIFFGGIWVGGRKRMDALTTLQGMNGRCPLGTMMIMPDLSFPGVIISLTKTNPANPLAMNEILVLVWTCKNVACYVP